MIGLQATSRKPRAVQFQPSWWVHTRGNGGKRPRELCKSSAQATSRASDTNQLCCVIAGPQPAGCALASRRSSGTRSLSSKQVGAGLAYSARSHCPALTGLLMHLGSAQAEVTATSPGGSFPGGSPGGSSPGGSPCYRSGTNPLRNLPDTMGHSHETSITCLAGHGVKAPQS